VKYYSYFFTRQDISPEQQIVQTAHAALKLGVNSQRQGFSDDARVYVPHQVNEAVKPDETYFTVIGVQNEDALMSVVEILIKFGFKYEAFVEPDMGNQLTSIAVYPIAEDKKGPLKAFNLLKIK
jgi:hypothetical protein